jgi:hypothetical protein
LSKVVVGPGDTTIEYELVVAVAEFESVTVVVNVLVPTVVGVPEIIPVVEFVSVIPAGRVPVLLNVYGVLPPVVNDVEKLNEKGVPATALRPVLGVVMDSALASVKVAVVEVAVAEVPFNVLVTIT